MIQTKKDLEYYINSDLKSLSCYPITWKMRIRDLFFPSIWKYQVKLRKLEYSKNCKNNSIIQRVINGIKLSRLIKYGIKCLGGVQIPLNVFGPGLCICHKGTIIVNDYVRIGSNARIHAGINIGNLSPLTEDWKNDNVPVIGDNVYIGPGAKIYGKITIGDNVAIGANAVVNKDVPNRVTVAGVPAKTINNRGSIDMIIYGDEQKARGICL